MDCVTKHLLVFIPFLMCVGAANAEASAAFPGLIINTTATRSLDKAEDLYESGKYKRAYFIYRNELARIGDKYAQYMVGYMHLTGQGAEQDRIAATAWYRLAAERGTEEFVFVHNQLLVSLTPEQVTEYEQLFLDLRKEFGDLPLLMQALRKDSDLLRRRTGSRLGSGASPIQIFEMSRQRGFSSADKYYEDIEQRMKSRLELIARYTQTEFDDVDLEVIDLDAIEERVEQALERLD